MTEELQERVLSVGHGRVGRLMRENGIKVIWTSEGWLYLVVILDLYSRRVICWAPSHRLQANDCWATVSNRMKRDLAIRALDMAAALRQPPKGCIHHTDRGGQGGFNR